MEVLSDDTVQGEGDSSQSARGLSGDRGCGVGRKGEIWLQVPNAQLRMLVIHTKHGGFFVALVPAALSPEQLDAALDEFGIDAAAVLELGDWRTSADNVTVAFVPPLELN